MRKWRASIIAFAAAPLLAGCVGSATPSASSKATTTTTVAATGATEAPSAPVDTAPTTTAAASSTADTATVDSAGATPGGIYIVQAGDTFLHIASLTGTTVDRILAANGWTDPTHLIYEGMKLKLPTHLKS